MKTKNKCITGNVPYPLFTIMQSSLPPTPSSTTHGPICHLAQSSQTAIKEKTCSVEALCIASLPPVIISIVKAILLHILINLTTKSSVGRYETSRKEIIPYQTER